MSNERTANGGRLTRAMHKAAAALYAATVLAGGSDRDAVEGANSVGVHEASEVEPKELSVASDQTVPDLSSDGDTKGAGSDETEGILQGQSEGVPDSSGEAQR